VSHTLPAAIDAATLRQWARWTAHLTAECPRSLLRLGLHLHGEIAAAATALEADEAAYAEWVEQTGRELDVAFPPLDAEIPEVLPVQPRVDHEFGCDCKACCGKAVTP
jgi:hypothetical protein